MQWVDAYAHEERRLTAFYQRRFRGKEFRPAFKAWAASRPLKNRDAPLTPFADVAVPARRHRQGEPARRAGRAAQAGARANIQRSSNYVLSVVLFSVALFFAGVSTKLSTPRLRATLLVLGCLIFVGTLAWVATSPSAFPSRDARSAVWPLGYLRHSNPSCFGSLPGRNGGTSVLSAQQRELALILFAVVFGTTALGLVLGRMHADAERTISGSRSASCRLRCSDSSHSSSHSGSRLRSDATSPAVPRSSTKRTRSGRPTCGPRPWWSPCERVRSNGWWVYTTRHPPLGFSAVQRRGARCRWARRPAAAASALAARRAGARRRARCEHAPRLSSRRSTT